GGGTIQATAAGTLTLSGALSNGGNALTFDANTGNIAESGVISGAGSLTKTGSGSLTLSNSNSYTGTTTVSAGALIAGANAPVSANGAFGNAASAIVLGDANTTAN